MSFLGFWRRHYRDIPRVRHILLVASRNGFGQLIEQAGLQGIHVPVAAKADAVDPTGVGDAFRAGFLAGVAWKLSLERAAQVGALLATYVLETVGTQEYELGRSDVLRRFGQAYGDEAVADVEPHLSTPRP